MTFMESTKSIKMQNTLVLIEMAMLQAIHLVKEFISSLNEFLIGRKYPSLPDG
jgi:hypothetical protein